MKGEHRIIQKTDRKAIITHHILFMQQIWNLFEHPMLFYRCFLFFFKEMLKYCVVPFFPHNISLLLYSQCTSHKVLWGVTGHLLHRPPVSHKKLTSLNFNYVVLQADGNGFYFFIFYFFLKNTLSFDSEWFIKQSSVRGISVMAMMLNSTVYLSVGHFFYFLKISEIRTILKASSLAGGSQRNSRSVSKQTQHTGF